MIALMICEECNHQMTEIFTAQENMKLKGWMCESCLTFVPAIGREKKFTISDQEPKRPE
jgi:hypothetical protein